MRAEYKACIVCDGLRYINGLVCKVCKDKARRKLGYAVDKGRIVRPFICEDCLDLAITEGHHFDYTKPYWVAWLCRDCHKNRHHTNTVKPLLKLHSALLLWYNNVFIEWLC